MWRTNTMSDNTKFFHLHDDQDSIPDLALRYTQPNDAEFLKAWLTDPSANSCFPMCNDLEIDDAVRRWISFSRIQSSLTAELKGVPCGIITLYIQAYKRLQHQSEFGIIVAPTARNKGVGSILMKAMMQLAKERFRLELVHLQVYAENPAIRLYKRFGFREFGRQTHWIKEPERYVGRIFMERFL
jgi:RimJ/RimL family protein N-acetyltransferase